MISEKTTEPVTYDLGAHILTIQQEQVITIEDDTLVVQLDREETYRLLVILQEVFK